MAELKIKNVYKKFPQGQTDLTVLKDINLQVKDGEFLVLVGASGCGKSTLLRLIAGLENISNGEIYIGDRLVNNLAPKQRDIAMVFQNYALYPHLNIYDNMAFGLRRTKNPDANFQSTLENFLVETSRVLPKPLQYMSKREREIKSKVENIAQLLQLEKLLNRYPKQLSGGQKQRVALGRAIARNPQVFLMDEPLSNLDAKLRTETRTEIVKLQQQLGVTTIYVTHDQTEAMTMGDRIAIMNKGEIQQIATPLEIYHQPANLFVAEFIGSPSMNFIPVKVTGNLEISHPQFTLKLPEKWANILEKYQQKPVLLGIRPEHLKLGEKSPENLPVKIDVIEALGHETYLTVKYAETKDLQMRIEPDIIVKTGQEIWLKIDLEKIHLFDEETEKSLIF